MLFGNEREGVFFSTLRTLNSSQLNCFPMMVYTITFIGNGPVCGNTVFRFTERGKLSTGTTSTLSSVFIVRLRYSGNSLFMLNGTFFSMISLLIVSKRYTCNPQSATG
jgi:hypothetical protein